MLPEVLSLRPNAIVLYSGHNDRGNTIFRALANHRGTWDLRVLGVLSQVRLFQLLQMGLRGGDDAAGALPAEIQLTASDAEVVRSRYESNLRNLVRTARRAGVAVVLVTPVSNPLGHPFAYQCPEELQTLGLDASHGNHGALDLASLELTALAAAQQRAPACRELTVFQARMNIVAGDKAPALEVLESLRDNTRTPVQADRRTVETIRRVASTEGASLADVALEFRRAGGGIEPPGWFWDPVHLTGEGHRALAAVVGPVLEQALGLPHSQWPMPELPALTLDGRTTGLQKQPPPDEMP
jgi:lysophospholipase L1-like esterase